MSSNLSYSTVDVFTSTALAGNQLGIVLLEATDDTTSPSLTQDQKLAITREFNYSETVFIHPYNINSSSRRVDIFTSNGEIPFAGHPTIGSVHYILNHLSPEKDASDSQGTLDLKAGKVTGSIDRQTGFASADIPHDIRIHAVDLGWDRVVASQPNLANLSTTGGSGDLARITGKAVSIVNGMTFVLVDLTQSPDLLTKVGVTLQDVATPQDLDEGWRESLIGTLFYVRLPDQGDGVLRVKQRVMVLGLEDPATGSASCALSAYLALTNASDIANPIHTFELEQGTQMGRKSIIGCKVILDHEGQNVEKIVLSGQAKLIMKGTLSLD